MKAVEVQFKKLLEGRSQYRVPLFQRTYNWGEEQWNQLWDDVVEIYMMPERRRHFIGAVVTQAQDSIAGQAESFLLIDGQQRLTTLLTILSCIRNRALSDSDRWPNLPSVIYNTCLTNAIFNPPKDEFFKLRPTQRDQKFFEAVIENNAGDSSESNVWYAFNYFLKAIDNGDINGAPFNLELLHLCVTDYLELVSVTLDQNDSPHKIFESLNNTGMALGPSDLIRNYLFMHIKDVDKADAVYNDDWYPMQQSTGDKLDDFFWRYLMMDGSLPRNDETFDAIKEHLGKDLSEDGAIAKMREFANFAWHYRRLRQIDGANPAFDQQALRLNTWEVEVAYPFLMQALEWTENGDITWEALVESMEIIESFVIRRAVCGLPTNRLRGIFGRMAAQAKPDGFILQTRDYLDKSDWPTDEWFSEAFASYQLYGRRLDRTRLILDSLELHFGDKEHPDMNGPITVEHIMPQHLTDEWRTMLGPDATELHSKWLHTPGNLTLTAYNSELGNRPFSEKKTMLANSNFALSQSILERAVWDGDAIRSRGEVLVERAVRIWPR